MGRKKNNDISLPEKDLFRISEVAEYFGVTERTIRLWVDHGHLELEMYPSGARRISRQSIVRCRFPATKGLPDI